MLTVLLAIDDIGTGVQLEETLTRAGFAVAWEPARAQGPSADFDESIDVVVIGGDAVGAAFGRVVEAWRHCQAVPGVVAIGSPSCRDHAQAARVTLLAPTATAATLAKAVQEAADMRFTGELSWAIARRVLEAPPGPGDTDEAVRLVARARQAPVELVRTALRWHANHYVTDLGGIDVLREARGLNIPEVQYAKWFDGTWSLQRLVKAGPLDPPAAARLIWILASVGVIALTPEVHDNRTPRRRALAELRTHLRARIRNLPGRTYYDVLEVTPLAEYPEVEAAYQALARAYSPTALADHDLTDLTAQVEPMWQLVEKARSVVVDIASKGRYHEWLRVKLAELTTSWAVDPAPVQRAHELHQRGQKALTAGDVHQAMSDLAGACRAHPGHPTYEASLAWARFRVQVAGGQDKQACAKRERATVERLLEGCRPWPHALMALALLCAADADPDSARWHLRAALRADPNLAAAKALYQKLGGRLQPTP